MYTFWFILSFCLSVSLPTISLPPYNKYKKYGLLLFYIEILTNLYIYFYMYIKIFYLSFILNCGPNGLNIHVL